MGCGVFKKGIEGCKVLPQTTGRKESPFTEEYDGWKYSWGASGEVKSPVWDMPSLGCLLAFQVVMAGLWRVFKDGE